MEKEGKYQYFSVKKKKKQQKNILSGVKHLLLPILILKSEQVYFITCG